MKLYMLDANPLRHIVQRDSGFEGIAANIERIGVERITISAVAAAELHITINSKTNQRAHREQLAALLRYFRVEQFTKRAAEMAGIIQAAARNKGRQMPSPDYLIAAHAITLDRTLVSDDKDYVGVPGLKLENWIHR